ncbi:SDR family oxidoreductase [Hansschlegelia plantiphila]|uniref:Short-chain dehydrogenase n=1 Tax=Hansschlegelia plantiphila TaxID=374655 RepID=A0A9W6J043_9HYPH|nr:SDR family oxidoreductase [Hansschlegelia plantiphila]GLK68252.1 short-chain dehydrogenase [Hansschlegelia plantiphila]
MTQHFFPAGGRAPVVVVTGATAGVGRAIALRFAEAGYSVGLIARDALALEGARAEIESFGVDAVAVSADVASADQVFSAAGRIEGELGPIAIWVNNAMVTVISPFAAVTPEEYRRVTEVTYLGAVHGTMAALKHMKPRDRGRVIQIGSALAYRGLPLQSAYCGAKHAIRGFTESVRSELIHDRSNVRLMMVDLPAVNTPQFDWARTHILRTPRPMGRPVQPEAIADGVFRAAHGRGRDHWIGWTTALTVLGNAASPGFLDRYLAKAVEGQQTAIPKTPDRRDNLAAPVSGLHRTQGSFSREASARAPLLPAEAVRLGVVTAGALACAAIGALIGAAIRRR